jgi:hypothetical protein
MVIPDAAMVTKGFSAGVGRCRVVYRTDTPVLTLVFPGGVTPKLLISFQKAFILSRNRAVCIGAERFWRETALTQPRRHLHQVQLSGSTRLRVAIAGSSSGMGLLARQNLAGGDHGTYQTIQVMRRLIEQAQSDPEFIRFAVDLVRDLPAHDELSEVSRIYEFVHSRIRYTKDPVTKEKLYPPMELLRIGAGDCDDTSMLICALANALGYNARLITVSANSDAPNEFSHVYPEVEVPTGSGNWVPLDVARPGAQLGLAPEVYFRKRAWSTTDSSYTDLEGYGQPRGLAGYTRLGQIDSLLSQTLAETPQIIAAVQGNPTASQFGSTGSPGTYFVGAGGNMLTTPTSLQAGYGMQMYPGQFDFASLLPLALIGGLLFLVAK